MPLCFCVSCLLSLTVRSLRPQTGNGWGREKPVIVPGLPTNECFSPPQRLSARSAPSEVGSLWALMTQQLVSAPSKVLPVSSVSFIQVSGLLTYLDEMLCSGLLLYHLDDSCVAMLGSHH